MRTSIQSERMMSRMDTRRKKLSVVLKIGKIGRLGQHKQASQANASEHAHHETKVHIWRGFDFSDITKMDKPPTDEGRWRRVACGSQLKSSSDRHIPPHTHIMMSSRIATAALRASATRGKNNAYLHQHPTYTTWPPTLRHLVARSKRIHTFNSRI